MREYMSSAGTVAAVDAMPIIEGDDMDCELGSAHNEDRLTRRGRTFGAVGGDPPYDSGDNEDDGDHDQ